MNFKDDPKVYMSLSGAIRLHHGDLALTGVIKKHIQDWLRSVVSDIRKKEKLNDSASSSASATETDEEQSAVQREAARYSDPQLDI